MRATKNNYEKYHLYMALRAGRIKKTPNGYLSTPKGAALKRVREKYYKICNLAFCC